MYLSLATRSKIAKITKIDHAPSRITPQHSYSVHMHVLCLHIPIRIHTYTCVFPYTTTWEFTRSQQHNPAICTSHCHTHSRISEWGDAATHRSDIPYPPRPTIATWVCLHAMRAFWSHYGTGMPPRELSRVMGMRRRTRNPLWPEAPARSAPERVCHVRAADRRARRGVSRPKAH